MIKREQDTIDFVQMGERIKQARKKGDNDTSVRKDSLVALEQGYDCSEFVSSYDLWFTAENWDMPSMGHERIHHQ